MKKAVGIALIVGLLTISYSMYSVVSIGEIQAKDLSDSFRFFKKQSTTQTQTPAAKPVTAPVATPVVVPAVLPEAASQEENVVTALAARPKKSAPAKEESAVPAPGDQTPVAPNVSPQKDDSPDLSSAPGKQPSSFPSFASIFPNISMETLPIFLDVASAFLELMKEDPMIKEDLSKITYALGSSLTAVKNPDKHNAWDNRPMTDWERLLYCLEDILNPKNKEKFKPLILNMMEASEALKGADFLYGTMYSIGTLYKYRDPKTNKIMDLDQIDYALYRVMFQLNQNFKPRDTDDIKMSEMRSVLLALDAAANITAPIKGAPAKLAFSLMKLDPDGPDIKTRSDALEFFGGLMAKSMYYYPKSYHNTFQIGQGEYRPYPDPLKGADWFFYDQKITMAGILPMRGVNGVLYLIKNFTVVDYMLGVLTENLDSLYTVSGSTGKAHTTGQRHRLLTVAAPVIDHFYDKGYLPQFMKVLTALNEIPLSKYKSIAWNRKNATLYQEDLGTALEVVEGPYGYGFMYYFLRGASDDRFNNEADFLDPVLDIAVRVCYKLGRTPYANSNLLRGMFDELNKINLSAVVTSKEEIVDKIFRPNGPADIMYQFMHDNHNQLVQIGAGWGNVLLSAADQKNVEKNIFYTSDMITLLRKSILPSLSRAMRENNEVVKSMAGNIRKLFNSGTLGGNGGQNGHTH